MTCLFDSFSFHFATLRCFCGTSCIVSDLCGTFHSPLAQDDPDWHQNNSVRDMVKHHILPRTAGTGLGCLAHSQTTESSKNPYRAAKLSTS